MNGNRVQVNPESKKAKKKNGDTEELVNGPVESRGCTDLICILLFIISNIAMLVIASEGWN